MNADRYMWRMYKSKDDSSLWTLDKHLGFPDGSHDTLPFASINGNASKHDCITYVFDYSKMNFPDSMKPCPPALTMNPGDEEACEIVVVYAMYGNNTITSITNTVIPQPFHPSVAEEASTPVSAVDLLSLIPF
jgi:hypothetical protein